MTREIMARVALLSHFAAGVAVVAVPLTLLSAAGCARLHARTVGPPLETPAPPPRSTPIASQPIVASPPVGEVQPPAPVAINPPETPAPAPTAIKPPETPAPAPSPAPPPVASDRPPAPNPDRPPTLQTAANAGAAEQRTRTSLASATRDLGRIDVRSLSADAKVQYDIARRFVAQATDALNAKNFEFAQQLADKAATLAALLQRR
jgi:outer membrane biosynthesis protein TonB